ncbi:MAG: ROK family transcriptional regulator [Acidobacteriota bacterium]
MVLRSVRRYRQLSRAALARRTRLSEAAISRIVAELLREGLLIEQGGEHATGGRPGIGLQLNERYFQAIGVDIQNWETRVSLGTVTGRMLETRRFRTPSAPNKTLDLVAEHARSLVDLARGGRALAAGVSVRGLVNSETGIAELGSNDGWVQVPVRQYLSERLGQPVFVENNVRLAALAEYHCGSLELQGIHCLLFVKVDDGVGMGIILDGKLYRGPGMAAGELGQMVIADQRGPERHNRPGCLESLASNGATWERYRAAAGARRAGPADSGVQVKSICHLALEGDAAARGAILETARYLGIGIANAVWALDAEAVIIDGAITEAWPLVSAAIREQFPEGPEFLNFRNLVLRPSALAGEAAIGGAIALPFASMFSEEVRP